MKRSIESGTVADKDDKLAAPSRRRKKELEVEPLAIVGIGVCAASVRSLETLFANLPNDLGAAYLVAVRQQEGLTSTPSSSRSAARQ
jgi:two-component system CheB/CheR fusion protein